MGVKEGNELNGKHVNTTPPPATSPAVVLGIEPRVSGLLSKNTATEKAWPGTECASAESEIHIHFTLLMHCS